MKNVRCRGLCLLASVFHSITSCTVHPERSEGHSCTATILFTELECFANDHYSGVFRLLRLAINKLKIYRLRSASLAMTGHSGILRFLSSLRVLRHCEAGYKKYFQFLVSKAEAISFLFSSATSPS